MTVFIGLIAFALLTTVTQIGGIAMLIGWLLVRLLGRSRIGGWRRFGAVAAAFLAVYAVLTLFVVPPLAALLGRVPLLCGFSAERGYAAASPIYCALNRNYVDPRMAALLARLARHMAEAYPGTRTLYLDANLPFINGFPLIPHLSHDDGRKLDLAFYYADGSGAYLPGVARSPVGYWAFEKPDPRDAPACPKTSGFSLRWDMEWLQPLLPDFRLDTDRTRAALNWLVSAGREFGVERVLLEPHLAKRLGVSSPLLRFQGCQAARHDDHVHVQIRP